MIITKNTQFKFKFDYSIDLIQFFNDTLLVFSKEQDITQILNKTFEEITASDSQFYYEFNYLLKKITLNIQLIVSVIRREINNSDVLNSEYIELLEYLEEIGSTALTLMNLHRYYQLSLTNYLRLVSRTNTKELVLYKNNSILSLINRSTNIDKDNLFYSIVTENRLLEESYGKTDILLSYDSSILDGFSKLEGDSSYIDIFSYSDKTFLGKDLGLDLTFLEEDFEILTPEDTFIQSCNVLFNLRKGDNIDNIDLGLSRSSTTNYSNLLSYLNTVITDLTEVLSTDTSVSFEFSPATVENDKVMLQITVNSSVDSSQKLIDNKVL